MQINPRIDELNASGELHVRLETACAAELGEQWSYVGSKANQRGLGCAVDHATNIVLAYVFGKRKDEVFKLLEPSASAAITRMTGGV